MENKNNNWSDISEEIAEVAINTSPIAYRWLSRRLQKERRIIDKVISDNMNMVQYIPKEYLNYDTILGEPLFINQFRLSKFLKNNIRRKCIKILFFSTYGY